MKQEQNCIESAANNDSDLLDHTFDEEIQQLQINAQILEIQQPPINEDICTRVSSRLTKGKKPDRLIETCNEVSNESIIEQIEPKNFNEAVASINSKEWKLAMEEEIKYLQENNVWSLTELPIGEKIIGGKWVYKRKTDEHGNIVRFKARYVAQGYSQIFRENYDEVFAPVAKQTTIRTLLTIAGKRKMIVKHNDIKTAFLNDELEEHIYMKQPEGFIESGKENFVCKLHKGIYGLKQSAREWNKKLHEILTNDGFKRSEADQCLYFKCVEGCWMYVLVYVDDIIMAAENEKMITNASHKLSEIVELNCLGDLKYYLGINRAYRRRNIPYSPTYIH